jgi:hypothetical protein
MRREPVWGNGENNSNRGAAVVLKFEATSRKGAFWHFLRSALDEECGKTAGPVGTVCNPLAMLPQT